MQYVLVLTTNTFPEDLKPPPLLSSAPVYFRIPKTIKLFPARNISIMQYNVNKISIIFILEATFTYKGYFAGKKYLQNMPSQQLRLKSNKNEIRIRSKMTTC